MINEKNVSVTAMRGNIYDRNGKLLVSSAYSYRLLCDVDVTAASAEDTEKLFNLLQKNGDTLQCGNSSELFDFLVQQSGKKVLCDNLSMSVIAEAMNNRIAGVSIEKKLERLYHYDGYASHLLGHVGKIQESSLEYYSELGYPMDATVGIDGIENAFESYLHGEDGQMTVKYDARGNITESVITKEPVAGYDIYLSIDIEAQVAAENALAKQITELSNASSGAITALDVNSGQVLCCASYPTYTSVDFRNNYDALSSDVSAPLFNRAVSGLYAPGSVMKLAVAVAALEEKIIDTDTIIEDLGTYEYYDGYQPSCWIYLQNGQTHGNLNVRQAITHSCNYFFFETARLTTIDVMNRWSKLLGLGVKSGIELPEAEGIVAGPEARAINGEYWSEGETLAAAIGQSDNLFTPIGINSFVSAIATGGTRYSAQLLTYVKEHDDERIVYSAESTVLSQVDISADTLKAVRGGMYDASKSGLVGRLFFEEKYEIGAKTGTAQNASGLNNAVFTAFAPFENPEVAVVCIIENGENGYSAAYPAREFLHRYLNVD